ncbi:MAG: hypothetical protein JWM54_1321 [Acidobacteriaceae bacterium]|nr:hypothetical protein [Acidobacteriaceae bacterium]
MSKRESKIMAGRILGCERVSGGVVITFADQESFLFDAGFLYEIRVEHGRHVPNAEDESDNAS